MERDPQSPGCESLGGELARARNGTHELYLQRLESLVERHQEQARMLRKRKHERLHRVQLQYEAELKQADEEFEANREQMRADLVEEISRSGATVPGEPETGIITRKTAARLDRASGASGPPPKKTKTAPSFRSIKIALDRDEISKDIEKLKQCLEEDDVPWDVHLGSRHSSRRRSRSNRYD